MTIKELHIAFDQGVQYIASNKSRGFYPEEKDLIFNKMINRYIISRVRPKDDGSFEMDTIAAEQLKSLLANVTVDAEISSVNYKALLPSDLGWFLRAGAAVKDTSCLPTSTLTPTSSVTRYLHKIKLPVSSKTTAKYYVAATLDGINIATMATDRGETWVGVPAKEQRFSVFSPLIQQARREGKEVYIGKNPLNQRGDNNQYVVYITKTVGTTLTATADEASQSSVATEANYSKYVTTPDKVAPVRLIKTGYSHIIQQTPYWASTVHSPTAHLFGNILEIAGSVSYIVSAVDVFYLRKPAVVSLPLGITCDLPEEYHDEIVDLAITYAKGELNSPDWERKMVDLKTNTTAV